MKNIPVPTIEEVGPESQILFQEIKKHWGRVPNLYATMGYSSHALKAFIDLNKTIAAGALTPQQIEAVALVVSQVNGCDYCLAGHTLSAERTGLSEAETIEIRKGKSSDPKINALVALAKSMADNKGRAEAELLDAFFAQGFDNGALMELVALIAIRVFTNYTFAITQIPIDYRAAPEL